MSSLKEQAIVWSDRLGLPRLVQAGPGQGVTSLLFHQFRFGDESWGMARDRLQRQLDFLTRRFGPVDLGAVGRFVKDGVMPNKTPLLVTIDDAKRDILEVFDLFEAFDVPVTQFVCAGWSERARQQTDAVPCKAAIVAWLHFYAGPKDSIDVDGTQFRLDHAGNRALIDTIIQTSDVSHLAQLAEMERMMRDALADYPICDWSELQDLQGRGMTMGCHSVSHPRIARQSGVRQRFEIAEARKLVERHLGPCPYFAYPFGEPDSHSDDTYAVLQDLKFDLAFTTRPAMLAKGHDSLLLPRIAMPDAVMSDRVFAARACGGTVPLFRLKNCLS